MTNSFRQALLRGLSLAAVAGSALAGAPVLAAPEATTVAQGYGTTTTVDVVEVESVNGWYLTVGAGAIWPSSQNFHIRGTDFTGHLGYGGGFAVDGGLGYDFGALRAELTYGYSAPSLNNVHVNDVDTFDASGKVNKNDVMASLYWDVIPFGRFTPYIGGGLGYTNLSTPSWTIDGYRGQSTNKGLLGWQAKLGVSYALAYNWDVYAEGTYSGAEGYTSNIIDTQTYNDFGAKLGFRYRFAQPVVVVVPEPAPAPAPEPAPAPMPAPEPAPAPAPEPIRGLW
jgi:opacity protein-like surface antigen